MSGKASGVVNGRSLDLVAGIDGCRAGWFVVLIGYGGPVTEERHHLCQTFDDVLGITSDSAVTAIDIPIGLLDTNISGGRDCDREVRRLLGWPRRNSVFSPPIRPALGAATYEEAHRLNGGMSKQSWGILPKIREVDKRMTPKLQSRAFEVHPELSFYAMSGGYPMRHKKKSRAGKAERLSILRGSSSGFRQIEQALEEFPRKDVGYDDILDAYAAAWTAMRIAQGQARRVPEQPPVDKNGLRMEIWY